MRPGFPLGSFKNEMEMNESFSGHAGDDGRNNQEAHRHEERNVDPDDFDEDDIMILGTTPKLSSTPDYMAQHMCTLPLPACCLVGMCMKLCAADIHTRTNIIIEMCICVVIPPILHCSCVSYAFLHTIRVMFYNRAYKNMMSMASICQSRLAGIDVLPCVAAFCSATVWRPREASPALPCRRGCIPGPAVRARWRDGLVGVGHDGRQPRDVKQSRAG